MTPSATLPDLPRRLNKREQSISPRVMAWLQDHYHQTIPFEIKATKTGSIPKSAVADHQLKSLLECQTERGFLYKIPDNARIRLPFDGFLIKNTPSFVICVFLTHKVCLAFDPRVWNGAKPTSIDQTFSIPLWSKE